MQQRVRERPLFAAKKDGDVADRDSVIPMPASALTACGARRA